MTVYGHGLTFDILRITGRAPLSSKQSVSNVYSVPFIQYRLQTFALKDY